MGTFKKFEWDSSIHLMWNDQVLCVLENVNQLKVNFLLFHVELRAGIERFLFFLLVELN